nr:hypothetical protein [uncultured Dongia sp.]
MRTITIYLRAFFFALTISNSAVPAISLQGGDSLGPTSHCHFLTTLPRRPKIKQRSSTLTKDEWWAFLSAE